MTLATSDERRKRSLPLQTHGRTAGLASQIELEGSWRESARALDPLERRIGGKAVLHVD
jgi:hypothetical protein